MRVLNVCQGAIGQPRPVNLVKEIWNCVQYGKHVSPHTLPCFVVDSLCDAVLIVHLLEGA